MNPGNIFSEIIDATRAREDALLSPHACKSAEALRRDPGREAVPDWENVRAPFAHDADRILHSRAYTRYIDKTQVFYLFDNDHITHRVLHVQFVSKVARTIGRCLKLNEDLIEAIALGHDIGHVPFGHDGEDFLNEICEEKGIGGFAHNAQSARWLTDLENEGRGWNLCLQTLDGILSHNGEKWSERLEPCRDKTWDDFLREYKSCFENREAARALQPMTLEGCVVRVADVIAYVGRDIEDAITLGLIRREELPAEAVATLGKTNSSIINTLALDLVSQSYGHDHVAFSPKVFKALRLLLDFNYRRIYLDPRVREDSDKLRRLFRLVFDDGVENLKAGRPVAPARFLSTHMTPEALRETPLERAVVDFIAGMTDDFFVSYARRLLLPERFGRKAPGGPAPPGERR